MLEVQAWELLNTPDYSSRLTMGEFHKLLLRAGYSKEVAHGAAMKRGWDRLSDGKVM